jgi:hydroxymethylbilane synthase
VDVAVHSLKDLPTLPVAWLALAAVPERGPTGDVFVSEGHRHFDDLAPGAVLATSSLRRGAQALHRRPDLRVTDIRGNVETRLRKLQEGGLDGIILAEAGLLRLGLAAAVTEVLDPAWMLPAVGQGALGLECRADDEATLTLLRRLNHVPTERAALAERALLRALGGGCQVPLGAVSRLEADGLSLRGAVVSPDGRRRVEAEASGSADDPKAVGRRVADLLLARGAGRLF